MGWVSGVRRYLAAGMVASSVAGCDSRRDIFGLCTADCLFFIFLFHLSFIQDRRSLHRNNRIFNVEWLILDLMKSFLIQASVML